MISTNAPHAETDYDQEFWDLITADEDLLRAEFDALIAANWPGDPGPAAPDPQVPRPGLRRPPVRPAATAVASCPVHSDARPRQRSPPRECRQAPM